MADKVKASEDAKGGNDKEAATPQSSSLLPSISVPKGGGAIRGIGEKFGVNPVTGTGSLSVPIFTSPGRSGFGPQLSLSYDSGSGNGPFGFGWSLSLPSITRKTDKGLPKYQDANESDEFILSGAEDLVPVLKKDTKGNLEFDEDSRDGYTIRRYRPRIEGLFARVERWTHQINGDVHWRSISKDNILTVYGRNEESRIFDPVETNRIFCWLICESYDDKGNAIIYEYKAENDEKIDWSLANESNRLRTANRYLKRILYGNCIPLMLDITKPSFRKPHLEPIDFSSADWMFELVFDYGEGHYRNIPLDATKSESEQHRFVQASASTDGIWPSRPDPFSIYRSGFEVRTYRRCHRVLMFHRFQELAAEKENGNPEPVVLPYLVRSTEFDYSDMDYSKPFEVETEQRHRGSTRFASFIRAITQSGYVWDESQPVLKENGAKYLTYLIKSLPPLEFDYSQAMIQEEIEELTIESLENLPQGLDGSIYQLVDLDGEGVSGILMEQGVAWFYKPNLGEGKFGPMEMVATKPSLALLSGGRQQLLDLAGDGQLDVVMLDSTTPGFYERNHDQGWENFTSFRSLPNLFWKDPNLKFVDLTGDGHADVMITENEAIVWHPSLAEVGFGPAERVHKALDEERGPRLVFDDGTQSIYLADMSGDGLVDLVRIRNGEVCYWPNLGYGNFGAKVTMDNAPWFDSPDQFDQKRIRLADIDGSSTTDIIYLKHDGVEIYFNQSGNRLSDARKLSSFPQIDNLSSVQVADLFGNGTACLIWSSPLPGDAGRQMCYVNLMGQDKPHLMLKTINNLGAETSVHYAASTKFYLQDKRDGKPWITRLPFPVHVVERVETYDHISRNRFVTRYAYHHGYFDGEEREFRGFGMIEQWDTEQIAALIASGLYPQGDNNAYASHVPPIRTKTWFHTGAYVDRDNISLHFEDEYYREPGLSDPQFRALLLPDTILPTALTAEEEREACRALKGMMLRQETYADDAGTDASEAEIWRAMTPYIVVEQNFTIRALQPRSANLHAVFFIHPRETITYHYERNPTDPRIQHALTLEVDSFGNVLKEAAIGYGRRQPDVSLPTDEDRAKQNNELITYTENRVTNVIEMADAYRSPLSCEVVTFELTGYTPTGAASRYQTSDFIEPNPGAPGRLRHKYTDQVAYEAQATANSCRRPIEWLRTLYRRDDLSDLLPLGELQPLALSGESYQLAFTPGLLTQVFQRRHAGQPTEALLPNPSAVLGGQGSDQGGYVDPDGDGNWWIPSGRSFFTTNPADNAVTELAYALQHFFLRRRYRDPFGQNAFVDFDANDLLMVETRDQVDNRVTVNANDYRILQPRLISDPNRNQTEVAFDALGMVVGTAIMGKPLPAPVEGDTLTGFVADLTQAEIDDFFRASDPHDNAPALLLDATTRIVYDLERFYRTRRENPNDPIQWKPPYAATLARETHVNAPLPSQGLKIQLSFSYSDGFGREIQKKIQAEPKPLVDGGPTINPLWVGSGWTIFNNKGKPVRQYEPFFSPMHCFEFGIQIGVSAVLFYDPAERVIATLHPNHTFEKVVFDPWHQITYDVNDTCANRNTQTGDPRTDPDIAGYVAEYFKAMGPAAMAWQTWYAQRIGGSMGQDERNAALGAAEHADTPTTALFDVLGRPFLTLACNRVVCAGHDQNGDEDSYATRVDLDIEGNQRAVRDAIQQAGDPLGRIVMQYDYDMLGNRIHQASMEAGERWMLNDVLGNPIRIWDSRGHNFFMSYDELRRPLKQHVSGTSNDSDQRTLNRKILFDKIEYGEGQANAEKFNLRTRILRHYDSAGVATNARLDAYGNPLEAYDFKGNLLRSTRRLVIDYTDIPDWSQPPALDDETFEGSTRYDALNRPIQTIAPHSSLARAQHPNRINVIQPIFNEANLLERLDVWLERAVEPAALLDPKNEAFTGGSRQHRL